MKRRQALKSTAAAALTLAAGPALSGTALKALNRKDEFAAALRSKPWLSGFAHTDQ